MDLSARSQTSRVHPIAVRVLGWLITALIVAITLLGPVAGTVLGHQPGHGHSSHQRGNSQQGNNQQGNQQHGNRGTVKIVNDDPAFRSPSHQDEDEDAAVGCSFHIQLSHFNAAQTGAWHVDSWPPTGSRTTVLNGTYKTDSAGRYTSSVITSLGNGHYKLFLQGRNSHNVKHKSFWVRCGPSTGQGTATGSLQIVKVVSGNTTGFAGGTFTFTATCGASSTATSVSLASGVTVGATTLSGLTSGTSCNVVETGSPNAGLNATWGSATYNPSAVSIVSGSTVTVTVTNPRSITPPPAGTGDLQIVKIIGGNTSGFPGGTFLFTATCAGTPIAAAITITSGGSVGSTTISGLAPATTCAVVETGEPAPGANASWGTTTYSPTNATVTIVGGSTVAVTVTDPRAFAAQTGTLQITKIVNGATAGFPGGTFSFTANCGGNLLATSITLASGVTAGSTSIGGIAAGTSCTVIETGSPSPGAGAFWSALAFSPANGVVTIVGGSSVTITVIDTRSVL